MKAINYFIIIILGVVLIACEVNQDGQINANKKLVKEFTQAVNNADWAAFDLLLTDNFQRHSQASPIEVKTREAFVDLQKSFYSASPDQKITMEMIVAEGNLVAAYATYTGTQTGPLGELQATGKSMNSKFITFFRIQNGRIAELWVEWDNLTMLTQLGHFPSEETKNKD